jgi:pentatricopeptide repeat protein
MNRKERRAAWRKECEIAREEGLKEPPKPEAPAEQKPPSKPAAKKSKPSLNVIGFNKMIQEYGSQRRLAAAKLAFEELQKSHKPTVVSFNVMIYACVKCDNLALARDIFEQMQSNEKTPPTVISYTTLLKGFCQGGDMASALKLVDTMQEQKLEPNIRTLNMVLRGALWSAEVGLAHKVWENLCVPHRGTHVAVTPDAIAVEYIVKLLSQGLQVNKARKILEKYEGLAGVSPSAYLSLATGCAMVGKHALCRTALELGKKALDAGPEKANRAVKPSKTKEADRAGNKQMPEFKAHQFKEAQLQYEEIHKFATRVGVISPSAEEVDGKKRKRGADADAEIVAESQPPPELLQFFLRMFLMPQSYQACVSSASASASVCADAEEDGAVSESVLDKDNLATALAEQLKQLGYPSYAKACAQGRGESDDEGPIALDRQTLIRRFQSMLTKEGRLRTSMIFDPAGKEQQQSKSKSGSANVPEAPLKLEVCSGSGDWITSQAKNNPNSNYIALELRRNRCYHIFTKMVFEQVGNLAVVGGDAAMVLSRHITPSSVSEVFVNFPEPPADDATQEGSDKHLLTADFMKDIGTALVEGGKLIIVTDNKPYANQIATTLTAMAAAPGAVFACAVLPRHALAENRAIGEGLPSGPQYGGGGGYGSSYFDRLWATRSKDGRYHIVFRKTKAATGNSSSGSGSESDGAATKRTSTARSKAKAVAKDQVTKGKIGSVAPKGLGRDPLLPCKFFMKGLCKAGAKCKFMHPDAKAKEEEGEEEEEDEGEEEEEEEEPAEESDSEEEEESDSEEEEEEEDEEEEDEEEEDEGVEESESDSDSEDEEKEEEPEGSEDGSGGGGGSSSKGSSSTGGSSSSSSNGSKGSSSSKGGSDSNSNSSSSYGSSSFGSFPCDLCGTVCISACQLQAHQKGKKCKKLQRAKQPQETQQQAKKRKRMESEEAKEDHHQQKKTKAKAKTAYRQPPPEEESVDELLS